MGKYLADHMLRALLFHLVRRVNLELPEGEDMHNVLADDMTLWVRTPQMKLCTRFRTSEGEVMSA